MERCYTSTVCLSRFIFLSDSSRRGDGGNGSRCGSSTAVAVDLSLRAVAGDVAGFAAAVAGLTRGVERSAVRSRAVARDVAQLAASVALHGLSLAIAGEVVGSTALVASSRTATTESAPEATAKCTARSTSATSHASARVGAVAGQVAGETARVAPSARSSAAQPKSRAVSLDVAKALAVVALLRLGGARVRASVRLVARLLAYLSISDKAISGRVSATYSCSTASQRMSTPLSI